MKEYDVSAIELLMDNMDQGVMYVDRGRRIRTCSRRAKEIMGIVINPQASHDSGHLAEGDIVILADNKLGGDDGDLGPSELALLNICDKGIQPGDMLTAVGVYQNRRIEPRYKYLGGGYRSGMSLKLDVNYFGFHIEASVDPDKAETRIRVGTKDFPMGYYYSVGNMVVIDGKTGSIKFFQAKGYSVRSEDAGKILRGQSWLAKHADDRGIDVKGRPFLDFFDQSPLSEKLFEVLDGRGEQVSNRLYEINKRPLICDIVPWPERAEPTGAVLIIRSAVNLDSLLEDRNELIRQIEERKEKDTAGSAQAYPEDAFSGFAGKSKKAQEVKYLAWKAANSRFNVILTGESGTGKSKLAQEIHRAGTPEAPFVEVNCNAIAPTLFESELFGYVGGAFTGAKSEGHMGYFEAANKGTIFLDEIGEIPLEIQVKLLQVLQNKIIYRVGSSKPIKVDVRVIAATNRNLEEEVAMGRFRQDLFYRINVFPIEIPPIRERKADLYLLINQLLKRICDSYGLEQKQFSGEAIQKMVAYNWPGNVRELENAIERAITLCDSNIIYSEHLRMGKGAAPVTMKELLAKEEERILEMTLMKYNGDKKKAMEELDMSRTVFYDKLKKYEIKY